MEIKKSSSEFEEKVFPFEYKVLTEPGTFTGYASIFTKPDLMNEIMEPEAFTRTLKQGNIRPLLWYHQIAQPLGLVELEVDKKGLKVSGTLNLEVQAAKEKYELMKQGVIKGLSVGIRTIKDAWEGLFRRLKEVKLFEVSLVTFTFQAHPKSLITAVKQAQLNPNPKSIKDILIYLEEIKSGRMISTANLKLINNAVEALVVIL